MSAEKLQDKPIKEFPPKQYGSGGEAVFDNRVHIRDSDSGRLVKKQHYAKHTFGNTTLYERPIGSGNMFGHSGEPIGNWKPTSDGRWEKILASHKDAPAYEKVLAPEDLVQRNYELEAEIAALKADLEEKTAPASIKGKA